MIRYCKSFEQAIDPVYSTFGSACFDLAIPNNTIVQANRNKVVRVDLGLRFFLEEGECLILYPRSSLFYKRCCFAPVGVIDWDYTGSISAILMYVGCDDCCILRGGERIVQGMVVKSHDSELCADPNTLMYIEEREKSMFEKGVKSHAINGFGSTGF